MARRRRMTLIDLRESDVIAGTACRLIDILAQRHPEYAAINGAERIVDSIQDDIRKRIEKAEAEPESHGELVLP